MPETTLPEYQWKITLRKGGKRTVRAMYATEHIAGSTDHGTTGYLVLKDTDHKPVFLAPYDQVAHVERGKLVTPGKSRYLPLPEGLNCTANQIRDLQDALHAILPDAPAKVVILPAGATVTDQELFQATERERLRHRTRNGGKGGV